MGVISMSPKILFQNQFQNQSPSRSGKNLSTPPIVTVGPKTILALPILTLLNKYQESLRPPAEKETTRIHVDELASKVAYLYERIIKIIDWKEENLLRRNAIERFLKRNLIAELSKVNFTGNANMRSSQEDTAGFSPLRFIFKTNVAEISELLVRELIRGGHLPNDEIGQEKIPAVQKIVEKYLYLIKNAPFDTSSFVFKKRVNFYNWILEIAACEIEEVLSPPLKENALMETMTLLMAERIRLVPENSLSEEEKILQTNIAVHRTLFDLDEVIIAYHLLKDRFPQWKESPAIFLDQVTKNIFSIQKSLENDLHHPLGREFFNLCEKTDTVFTIISDILDNYQKEPKKLPFVILDKQNLKVLITKAYNNRIATLKNRLFKLAVFSSLSVFVANWFTFFVVEVPIAHLFYQGFNLLAATVDFLLPTAVMFFLVSLIKPPPSSNLNKVIGLTNQFVYTDQGKEILEIKLKKKKRPLTIFIISLIYLLVCLGTFYLIARVFFLAQIPLSSVILDTIGIALNVFAALIVRNKARELTVEEKSSFWEFLLDVISLPMAEIGSWIASKWKEYNVVSVFFNVIIETPFKTLIDFIENWRQFLKERKAAFH